LKVPPVIGCCACWVEEPVPGLVVLGLVVVGFIVLLPVPLPLVWAWAVAKASAVPAVRSATVRRRENIAYLRS
jgi:hypothetical protein